MRNINSWEKNYKYHVQTTKYTCDDDSRKKKHARVYKKWLKLLILLDRRLSVQWYACWIYTCTRTHLFWLLHGRPWNAVQSGLDGSLAEARRSVCAGVPLQMKYSAVSLDSAAGWSCHSLCNYYKTARCNKAVFLIWRWRGTLRPLETRWTPWRSIDQRQGDSSAAALGPKWRSRLMTRA